MSLDLKQVKQLALAELAKQIQENPDKTQTAFLAESYKKLEEADSQKQIADALLLLPTYQNTAKELIKAKEELLNVKEGLITLGKPAIRLFRKLTNYYHTVPQTGNSSNVGYIKYEELDWIKNNLISNSSGSMSLEISTMREIGNGTKKASFDYQTDHVYYNCSSCPQQAYSLYILKNKTEEEKQVDFGVYLSSNGGSGWRGAYVVVEGITIWSTTGNSNYSPSFTGNNAIKLPPKTSKLIYIHNAAYNRTNNNNVYYYHLRHHTWFDLPQGVEFEYEAYKYLIGGDQ